MTTQLYCLMSLSTSFYAYCNIEGSSSIFSSIHSFLFHLYCPACLLFSFLIFVLTFLLCGLSSRKYEETIITDILLSIIGIIHWHLKLAFVLLCEQWLYLFIIVILKVDVMINVETINWLQFSFGIFWFSDSTSWTCQITLNLIWEVFFIILLFLHVTFESLHFCYS